MMKLIGTHIGPEQIEALLKHHKARRYSWLKIKTEPALSIVRAKVLIAFLESTCTVKEAAAAIGIRDRTGTPDELIQKGVLKTVGPVGYRRVLRSCLPAAREYVRQSRVPKSEKIGRKELVSLYDACNLLSLFPEQVIPLLKRKGTLKGKLDRFWKVYAYSIQEFKKTAEYRSLRETRPALGWIRDNKKGRGKAA